ncbi:hypothetical protein XFF6992_710068 [Xanthomonas citri pv. fuscans]|nr:hypothetical protein XFF6992_190052 [Xanthomonas citri pv. fuscans]SOO18742.1 hypothetical protein XFF6992_260051 [Xanthomonas citri pv. fuscans]SOO21753.1 hypothetical protein XFF6992_710068 [Xanthomonas citri pv. fuscans]SOO32727.1 hypothetical protein XFF6994_2290009 [Xanthomonas citri pv. fuscans]
MHMWWAVVRVAGARVNSDVVQHGHRLARWFGFPIVRLGATCVRCNRFLRDLQMCMAILRA